MLQSFVLLATVFSLVTVAQESEELRAQPATPVAITEQLELDLKGATPYIIWQKAFNNASALPGLDDFDRNGTRNARTCRIAASNDPAVPEIIFVHKYSERFPAEEDSTGVIFPERIITKIMVAGKTEPNHQTHMDQFNEWEDLRVEEKSLISSFKKESGSKRSDTMTYAFRKVDDRIYFHGEGKSIKVTGQEVRFDSYGVCYKRKVN